MGRCLEGRRSEAVEAHRLSDRILRISNIECVDPNMALFAVGNSDAIDPQEFCSVDAPHQYVATPGAVRLTVRPPRQESRPLSEQIIVDKDPDDPLVPESCHKEGPITRNEGVETGLGAISRRSAVS